MKAISLWQPWASLLVLGEKRIETRSWGTTHAGPLAIHAAKTWNAELEAICRQEPFRSVLARHGLTAATLPRGVVLGSARLVECLPIVGRELPKGGRCIGIDEEGILRVWHPFTLASAKVSGHSGDGYDQVGEHELEFGDYRPGRWGWVLTDAVALAAPVPLAGRQGLFNVVDYTALQAASRDTHAHGRLR